MTERYVTPAEFTRRLDWKPGTVYRKVFKTRQKVEKNLPLTNNDIPLPDHNIAGEPRWKLSTFEDYVKHYGKDGKPPEAGPIP